VNTSYAEIASLQILPVHHSSPFQWIYMISEAETGSGWSVTEE
jgi:hypothetical protein